jgi:hypothetical protein
MRREHSPFHRPFALLEVLTFAKNLIISQPRLTLLKLLTFLEVLTILEAESVAFGRQTFCGKLPRHVKE